MDVTTERQPTLRLCVAFSEALAGLLLLMLYDFGLAEPSGKDYITLITGSDPSGVGG
jgi:hypothetical protein